MNFSVENPNAFYLLICLVFALVFSCGKFTKLSKSLAENNELQRQTHAFVRFRRCFILRTVFRGLSTLMVILAFAGISWGTNFVPSQRSGRAVSMVFDISYSMEAPDAPEGMSRLEAAENYAMELLKHADNTRFSVVIAKGDGAVVVPLTEDYQSVKTALHCLSPKLMTSIGTSLGNGVLTAISSFPEQSSEANTIWVFTDGEETDDKLQGALTESLKYGIPVVIIGFGSERETEVYTGDGSTKIKTALRSDLINKTISSIQKKNNKNRRNGNTANVTYVDASEMGSAYRIIKMLMSEDTGTQITYESQLVPRRGLFILLGVIFFIASFLFGEMDVQQGKKKLLSSVSTAIILLTFTGCSGRSGDRTRILEGSINWSRKNYQKAVANFLEVQNNAQAREDHFTENFALYGLATTYLMQNETEAAMNRYSQITPDAPDSIRYAVLYNAGIIAHRNGDYDMAAEFFKQALLINSSSTNAKINMELSLQENTVRENTSEKSLDKINVRSDDKTLENELFSIIMENEQTQWKNQQTDSDSSAKDY